ncbi:MAG: antibiotic biosynthesis monooxygenase [Demequinaceae bacterium]|nr:antibiotic biosynthesis monooxygenase [Demequinaceae bacterium]
MESEFEAAFAIAEPLIQRAQGYRGHSLRRGVEHAGTYLLTVGWDSVEAHEVGFRGSADYANWRELLHHFYEPMPTVLHYGEDLATPRRQKNPVSA